MAPSRKTTARKERQARSRSPATRPQRIRNREDLPNRVTRRSSTLTLHDHRIPVDCPLPGCNAATVHQHYNNLQFFNPHPANEIRSRGYANSHRLASSQHNVGNGGRAMQGQDMFESEILHDEKAVQEQDRNKQTSVVGYDKTEDQEEPRERRTLIITLRVAAAKEGHDAVRSMALADLSNEQQAVVIPGEYIMMTDGDKSTPGEESCDQRSVDLADQFQEQEDVAIVDGAALEDSTMMNDRTFDLTPSFPIISRRTLDLVEDLSTSLQTIPMEIDYKTIANAWDSQAQAQPEESSWTTSPKSQNMFGEWLVPRTAKKTSKRSSRVTESLGDALHNVSWKDGDHELPSTAMYPAPSPYMLQFQVNREGEDDFEAIFGHSNPLSEME